jgi:hypothetical protein
MWRLSLKKLIAEVFERGLLYWETWVIKEGHLSS